MVLGAARGLASTLWVMAPDTARAEPARMQPSTLGRRGVEHYARAGGAVAAGEEGGEHLAQGDVHRAQDQGEQRRGEGEREQGQQQAKPPADIGCLRVFHRPPPQRALGLRL